jgi:hypothetical protein
VNEAVAVTSPVIAVSSAASVHETTTAGDPGGHPPSTDETEGYSELIASMIRLV